MEQYVFALVVILLNGTPDMSVGMTNKCPDKDEFSTMMEKEVHDGHIKDWRATCLKLPGGGKSI